MEDITITGGPPPCGLLVSRVEEIELSTEVSWILGKLVPALLDFGETCPGCSGVNFNLLLIKSLCLSLQAHVSCMKKKFSFSSSSHATCLLVKSYTRTTNYVPRRQSAPFPLSCLLMLEKSSQSLMRKFPRQTFFKGVLFLLAFGDPFVDKHRDFVNSPRCIPLSCM